MATLPADIVSKAFVASNGELAWRREDIKNVVTAIRDSGRAILGGEVWLITGEQSWNGLIPRRDGGSPAVWHWETGTHSSNESWRKYCERTCSESLKALQVMNVDNETPTELIAKLRFNFTITDD
jgi:hypothetical protein